MRNLLIILLTLVFTVAGSRVLKAQALSIGPGGDYETLRDAFGDINNGTLTGSITFGFLDNITETATAVLYESGYEDVSNYSSITIDGPGNITISPNFSGPIISLDGADNVSNGDIMFKNTNDDGYGVQFVNDACNNTITYCTFYSLKNDPNYGTITFWSAGSGSGNDNNIIDHCIIRNDPVAVTKPNLEISSWGTEAKENSNNTISTSRSGIIRAA